MCILLLTAIPVDCESFEKRIEILEKYIASRGNTLIRYNLQSLDLHYCTGCFNCWWKTPGRCVIHDDMEILYPEILKADLLLFTSPLVMGLPSYLIKKCQDRLIPLLHPLHHADKG